MADTPEAIYFIVRKSARGHEYGEVYFERLPNSLTRRYPPGQRPFVYALRLDKLGDFWATLPLDLLMLHYRRAKMLGRLPAENLVDKPQEGRAPT